MDDLLIDRITIKRVSDVILNNKVLPFSTSVNKTFSHQPVVLEFVVASGTTSSYSIVGVKNNGTLSDTVVFNGSNTRTVSKYSFDGITTINSLGGNSSLVNVFARTQSGQPAFIESDVVTNQPARLSKQRQGSITIRREQLVTQDEHLAFIKYGPNLIKPKDKIIHLSTGDTYLIADVDDIMDSTSYHHTEMTINLIDRGLE